MTSLATRSWARSFAWWGAALFCLCLWGFLEIAEDFPEGQFREFDRKGLMLFRSAADPSVPRGPIWLKEVMQEVSSLGSAPILGLTVTAVVGYLFILRRWIDGWGIVLACLGGGLLNGALKSFAARPRPAIVPHLTEVSSSSFPSGHSMLSAIVYLSLGVMVARLVENRWVGVYAVAIAIFLTSVVGITRVYLGVHYPTDVLAGWTAGTAWALICVAVRAQWMVQRTVLSRRTSHSHSTDFIG